MSHKESVGNDLIVLLPALRAFARTLYRDATNADDLVQDTLTKALSNIDQFEPGTRMKSWLFTIMRNTFYTSVKRYNRETPGLLDCVSGTSATEASQEWSIRSREMHEAIQLLPPHQREVLVLIGVLGTSYEETAVICGCAVGTVKSRLNRARLFLIEKLGENSAEAVLERSANHLQTNFEADSPRRKKA